MANISPASGPPTPNASFLYDAVGNLVQTDTQRFYQWDAADQLVYTKVQPSGGPVEIQAAYLYDAGGQRVKRYVRGALGGTFDASVYIDGIYEHRYQDSAHLTTIMVKAGRSQLASLRIGDPLDGSTPPLTYELEDHLGTIVARLDQYGAFYDREEFYPFGEHCLRQFTMKRYGYVGKEYDLESGLLYYGARYYAAWTCRFISVDPLAAKYAQLTPYNYAANNPVGDLDIDGMQATGTAQSKGGEPPHGQGLTQDERIELGVAIKIGPAKEPERSPAAPKGDSPQATDTLSAVDAARIYATIHGFAAPINTSTPQSILRAAEKPLATSIKEGLQSLSEQSGEAGAIGFVGLMAYGITEDAWIFLQCWGVGTPRDLEGATVGATQRQDAFFNTAAEAMGPLMKGGAALSKSVDTFRSGGDELLESLGPARLNHTEELAATIERVEAMGGKISWREGEFAFSPALGEPGKIILDPNSSISAVRHEVGHFFDDVGLGHPGLGFYIQNPDIRWGSEFSSYLREIQLARQIGDRKAAEMLLQNARTERFKLLRR